MKWITRERPKIDRIAIKRDQTNLQPDRFYSFFDRLLQEKYGMREVSVLMKKTSSAQI